MNQRLPPEPVGAWSVASTAARLYTESLQTVLPIAIPAALAAVLLELLQPSAAEEDVVAGVSPELALATLVAGVAYAWLVVAVQHRVYRFAQGGGATGESLRVAATRLLPLVGAMVVAGLAVGVPFAVVIGLVAWAWRAAEYGVGALLGAVAGLGLLYVGLRLAPLTAEVVLRPAGPIAALRRSWQLTRGRLAHIALVYLALLMLIVAVFVAAMVVAAVLGVVAPSLARFLGSIVSVVLLSVFMLPFGASVVVALWHDLRLRAGEPVADQEQSGFA